MSMIINRVFQNQMKITRLKGTILMKFFEPKNKTPWCADGVKYKYEIYFIHPSLKRTQCNT